MTLPEFLARVKAVEGEWTLDDKGMIRLGCHCPLLVVMPRVGDNWWAAGEALGLSKDDRRRVVYAADNSTGMANYFDPVLRSQLLAVTVQRT